MSFNVMEFAQLIMDNADLKDEVMAVINNQDFNALAEILGRFGMSIDESQMHLVKGAMDMISNREGGEGFSLDDLTSAAGGIMGLFK